MYPQLIKNYAKTLIKDLGTEHTTYNIKPTDISNNYNNYYVINITILIEKPSEFDPESTTIQLLHTQLMDEANLPIIVDKEDIRTLYTTLKEEGAKIGNKEDIQKILE